MTVERVAERALAVQGSQPAAPHILFANTNLADADFAHLAASPETLQGFARRAGYDAVEWHPLYTPAQIVGNAVAQRNLLPYALHQSPRTGWKTRGTADIIHGGAGMHALLNVPFAGRFFMPEMAASADYMATVVRTASAKLQEEYGAEWGLKPMPGIFYPQRDAAFDAGIRARAGASAALAQPSDRLARILGVATVEDMTDVLLDRDYGYWDEGKPGEGDEVRMPYALNTTEVRRHYGRDVHGPASHLETSIEHLAINAGALQVAVGIEKLARREDHIPTMQELKHLLDGRVRGHLRDIFEAVKARPEPLDFITVQIPAISIIRVSGHHYTDDVLKHYAYVGDAMKAFFRS